MIGLFGDRTTALSHAIQFNRLGRECRILTALPSFGDECTEALLLSARSAVDWMRLSAALPQLRAYARADLPLWLEGRACALCNTCADFVHCRVRITPYRSSQLIVAHTPLWEPPRMAVRRDLAVQFADIAPNVAILATDPVLRPLLLRQGNTMAAGFFTQNTPVCALYRYFLTLIDESP